MSFKLEIKGLDATIKRVEALARSAKIDAQAELLTFANNVSNDAKKNLQRGSGGGRPTSNTGALANAIHADKSGDMGASVTVAKNYAAYVEFGTRKFAAQYVATLPQDWQTFAATFKGGGGSFDELVLSIFQWVKDRGIKPDANYQSKQTEQGDTYSHVYSLDSTGPKLKKARKVKKKKRVDVEARQQQMAYAIALKIIRDGVRAQPYLYPAIQKNLPDLKKRLSNIFKGK